MSLFARRPQVSNPVQYVTTVGLNKTILVIGLGNPGKKYDNTRHNIGFSCLDYFVEQTEEMDNWTDKKELKSQLSIGHLGQVQVVAVKPTTFMNSSGESVKEVSNYYKIDPKNIIIIHDELDVPFGQIRLRQGGGSAGHNGIKSIIDNVGGDNGRIRIGIGPKQPDTIDSADFVLQKFSPADTKHLLILKREIVGILNECIFSGEMPTDTRSFLD